MMWKLLTKNGVYLAWVISLVAILGSLYWSEILKEPPCSLCWYQRVFLFPLAVVLGVAAYRQDRSALFYGLPLALLGGLFALYHLLVQKKLLITKICSASVKCTTETVRYFGWITPPMLSLFVFFSVGLLLCLAHFSKAEEA